MAEFPRDWTIAPLGEIGDVLMCKRVLKSQTSPMGEIPFYKIGTFGQKADAFIPLELFERLRKTYSYPKDGDVLVSAAGTIGRTVVFDGSDSYFQDSNIVWIGNDERKVLNAYLHWWYQVVKWTTEDGGIVSRLYNGNFKAMTIAFPDIPEQRRIAEALGSIDKLIDNLTRRIEKKRLVKQGVMQELLTGKKRLPGFRGEWTSIPVSSLGVFLGGGTPSTKNSEYWIGQIPWISSSDLSEGDIFTISKSRFITKEAISCSATAVCPSGTIHVILRVGVGKVAISKEPECTSQDFTNLVVSPDFCNTFIAYLLSRVMMAKKDDVQGTSIKGLALSDFRCIRLHIPASFVEQNAIAAILSDMDTEIAKLEAKRDKYIDIKQGMMNDLLTGKVRI